MLKTTPAGFWTNYQNGSIESKINDQGPWGGNSEFHWKSNSANVFSTKEILDFAIKNGWQLTDSLVYKRKSIKPFTNYNDKNYSYRLLETFLNKADFTENYFFVFKTGWIAVEPGNERETNKNGFVIINLNQKEFTVYHLWGE
ncbi:hypothetical protein [Flavobacterium sp. DSP2-3-1]|uniref:hypothetical protein n=1 Tax=Flavobacterium sp. DSP2-3-1 TaxID=2804620 RepID=UPI003CECA16D